MIIRVPSCRRLLLFTLLVAMLLVRTGQGEEVVTLKVYVDALPMPGSARAENVAKQQIIQRFEELHPNIRITSSQGLRIEGKGDEIIPLMQIAADISPDVIYVMFKNSDSYIQQRFLMPLDRFIEQMPKEELDERVPPPAWQVIKRPGPDGKTHVWAMPYSTEVMALTFQRDAMRDAGLDPDTGPRDWKELEEFCRKIHAATPKKYGIAFDRTTDESWKFMSFLWSAGGEAMKEMAPSEWRAAYDSPEAVEAFYFYYRLVKEGLAYRGTDTTDPSMRDRFVMQFSYLNDKITYRDPVQYGVCPVPLGPTGLRGSEVNCAMMGIFAGVKDPRVADAAWEFIRFYDGPEARKIRTRVYVENGSARQVNPDFLRRFGFEEYLGDVPKAWEIGRAHV